MDFTLIDLDSEIRVSLLLVACDCIFLALDIELDPTELDNSLLIIYLSVESDKWLHWVSKVPFILPISDSSLV